MINDELVDKFKSRMHIFHKAEDKRLKNDLELSYIAVKHLCGSFDINKSSEGQELVFERTRYVYNEQLEFFEENFRSMIFDFGFKNIVLEGENNEF